MHRCGETYTLSRIPMSLFPNTTCFDHRHPYLAWFGFGLYLCHAGCKNSCWLTVVSHRALPSGWSEYQHPVCVCVYSQKPQIPWPSEPAHPKVRLFSPFPLFNPTFFCTREKDNKNWKKLTKGLSHKGWENTPLWSFSIVLAPLPEPTWWLCWWCRVASLPSLLTFQTVPGTRGCPTGMSEGDPDPSVVQIQMGKTPIYSDASLCFWSSLFLFYVSPLFLLSLSPSRKRGNLLSACFPLIAMEPSDQRKQTLLLLNDSERWGKLSR